MDNVISSSSLKGNNSSVLKPISSYTPKQSSLLSTHVPNNGWSATTIITVILIIILLAVLGINIFSYVSEGTDYLAWIIQRFSGKLPEKGKELVDTTVKGVDLGVDVAAGAVKDVGSVLTRELDLKRKILWEDRDAGIKKNIEDRHMVGINKYPEHEPNYNEDSEDDNIQEKHKPGFCYIGTDRGHRSCIRVKAKDRCESSKIFPTMDICVNPSLRK